MKKIYKISAGGLIGGGIGWLAYRFIGCTTGACPLTSNPFSAMLYFGTAGLVIMFFDTKQNGKTPRQEKNRDDND